MEKSTETIRTAYKGNAKHEKSEAIAPGWMLRATEAVMQYYLDKNLTLDPCILQEFPKPQEGHQYMTRTFLSARRFALTAHSIVFCLKNIKPVNTL